MSNYKIIFTGPVGAGKTTAIAAISDIDPVCTNELASDMTQSRKANTTVAMDYGMMKISDNERIHLYGTPGQERFDFMWDILTEGGIGLVLLLDNTRPDPFKDMRFFLNAFSEFIDGHRVAIGVTRMDLSAKPSIGDYHAALATTDLKPPVFEVDARRKDDVATLVRALLYAVDPGLTS